jgi:ABC-type bacteriocin/lantibiotic exporter with double-glycine peptidase domain
MRTEPGPLVAMVYQRHLADCGAAALAMWLGVSYEEVLLAVGAHAPRVLRAGVWMTELSKAAAVFGVTLRPKSTPVDLETDEGILQTKFRRGRHVVVLRRGLLFDTDATIWEPDDYAKAKRAQFGVLLTGDAR